METTTPPKALLLDGGTIMRISMATQGKRSHRAPLPRLLRNPQLRQDEAHMLADALPDALVGALAGLALIREGHDVVLACGADHGKSAGPG